MYNRKDTIAAICTPPGEGGVAMIRISGSEALDIADRIFSGPVHTYPTHTVHYGRVADMDTALLIPMHRGYTGELTVEIHCHGGSLISRRVLEAALHAGARVAQPGEFTFRAFFNGNLDLAQAEAVQDVIGAKSDLAMEAAADQLAGRLSKAISAFQKAITHIAAVLEAWVDFPEEGLEFATLDELCGQLQDVVFEMCKLRDTYEEGRRLREGISICLVGAPNVGKSSLLNALCDRDRAIVTHVPGTTRDVLEEVVQIAGFPVRLIDTAGIRDTNELIEQEGIRRSYRAMEEADLIIHLRDATQPDSMTFPSALVVTNKIDLVDERPSLGVSAKTGEGIAHLLSVIQERLWSVGDRGELILTNLRHKEALTQAIDASQRTIDALKEHVSPEFICLDLRQALVSLGQIIGVDVTEEVLTAIFSKFCLGK